MHKELIVFVTAASPIVELRGAIPLGIAMGMPISEVLVLSLLGNIFPVPLVLIGTQKLLYYLKKISCIEGCLSNWSNAKTRKLSAALQRWGWLGLLVFVAIPLPGTGAWTGAFAAALLGLKSWQSFICIVLGIIAAGIIVTLAGYTIIII